MRDITPKRPVGRPPRFNEDVKAKIIDLYTKGLTDAEVGKILDVTTETIRRWKHKDFELSVSSKEAKVMADRLVEESLYHRATGYSHPDVKIHVDKQGNVLEIPFEHHYPPDTVAAIFWLKNRQPDKWREKSETIHSLDKGPQVQILLPSNTYETLQTVIDVVKDVVPVETDEEDDVVDSDVVVSLPPVEPSED